MLDLRDQMGASVILITHDLGLIAEMADRVAVMYAGQIIEQTDILTLFEEPLHPYTVGLIESVPVLGQVKEKLAVIPGSVPNLIDMPPGCRFAPRCQHVMDICIEEEPELIQLKTDHVVRCWLYPESDQQKPL
jgi:oligopeptide/dipeptide ABC transporter ATP-binding protein